MDVYKIPIEYAFIVFPFIAFILTIPFLIHQYRTFGSIPILKSFFFYSMILYLICAYFLIIFPLPSIEKVLSMTGPTTQLEPFRFIKDIIVTTSFEISNIKDILNIFKQPTMYTVLFNIILMLPFGIFLRYIFKKKWYHIIIYTFFLSLFFELTQLSGLYGIYPRAYRIFDVDDLLINTIGGLIGYIITPLVTIFIPSIDELDKKGYIKGQTVTLLRRVVSLSIDILFIIVFNILAKILFFNTVFSKYSLQIVLIIYYLIIPPFVSGKTLGKKIINIRISSFNKEAKWYQIFIRNLLLISIIMYPFAWINLLKINKDIIWTVIYILQISNILYYIYTILRKNNHTFLYEKITKTINISTIEYNKPNNIEDGKIEKVILNNCKTK